MESNSNPGYSFFLCVFCRKSHSHRPRPKVLQKECILTSLGNEKWERSSGFCWWFLTITKYDSLLEEISAPKWKTISYHRDLWRKWLWNIITSKSEKNKIRHFQAVDDSYEDSDMGRMKMEQSRYSEKVSTCRRLKVVDYLSIQSSICAKNIMRTWLMSKIFRERIT